MNQKVAELTGSESCDQQPEILLEVRHLCGVCSKG